MPAIQELAGVPSFGGQLGQAFGQGISQGLNKQLESFQRGKAFEKAGLPRALADIDPTIAAQLIKQQQKNKLIESILNPQGDRPSTLDALNESGPVQEQNPLEPQRIQTPSIRAKQQVPGLTSQQRMALASVDPSLGAAAQREEQIRVQQEAPTKKAETARAYKYLDKIEAERDSVQKQKGALLAAESALANKDSVFLAEII